MMKRYLLITALVALAFFRDIIRCRTGGHPRVRQSDDE